MIGLDDDWPSWLRDRTIPFRMGSRMSVLSVRSWASSITITEYWDSWGSIRSSRISMPSVKYLSRVLALVLSSNRMQ